VPEDYQKRTYQKKMRAYLNALRAELDEIETKLQEPDTELEDQADEQNIQQARRIDDQAGDHLQAVENTDTVTWEVLRARLESAWDNLQGTLAYVEDRVVEPDDDEAETPDRDRGTA
jgi:hypothetical protein